MRRAELSDLQTVRWIAADAFAASQKATGLVLGPVSEDYRPRIERGEIWLLEVGTEPVGLAALERCPDHMFIYVIAVRANMQGKGFGSGLLDFAEHQAGAAGFAKVRLEVRSPVNRDRLVRFYERHGYTMTGTLPHPRRVGQTVVGMAKQLPTTEAARTGGDD
jgi:ribosomal protein S18 acetylase RimI-like enzyme